MCRPRDLDLSRRICHPQRWPDDGESPVATNIKVVDREANPIRKITLWDDMHRPLPVSFARNTGRPVLEQDKSYLLVVERRDGDELKMLLQASERKPDGPA